MSVFQSLRSSTVEKSLPGRVLKTRVRFGLSTWRSRLTKKCALLRTIGPPMTNPYSRFSTSALGRSRWRAMKSLEVSELLTM